MEYKIKNIFRCIPTLTTERLILRKILRSDYVDMFEYASNSEVTKYLTWSEHPDMHYTHKYLSYIQSKYKSGEFRDWALEYDNKMIGTCGFTSIDSTNMCGEIGYVISHAYKNLGLATEALKRVLKFGFEVLGLNRIEGRFISENSASRRVMEKSGMIFEGIKRESLFVKGRFVSMGICSILRKEWMDKC